MITLYKSNLNTDNGQIIPYIYTIHWLTSFNEKTINFDKNIKAKKIIALSEYSRLRVRITYADNDLQEFNFETIRKDNPLKVRTPREVSTFELNIKNKMIKKIVVGVEAYNYSSTVSEPVVTYGVIVSI